MSISVKSKVYLRHFPGISQAYLMQNSGISKADLRLISVYLMYISSISWAYFRQMSGISKTYLPHKSKANPRQISGIYDSYLRKISGISHANFS